MIKVGKVYYQSPFSASQTGVIKKEKKKKPPPLQSKITGSGARGSRARTVRAAGTASEPTAGRTE